MPGRLGFFVAGGIVGAVAAMLLTPYTGKEARAIVANKANDILGEGWVDQASENVQNAYQKVTAGGQRVVSEVVSRGQNVVNNVQGAVRGVANNAKPVFTEKTDDLREKIEAARERIAAQVAKNAQESLNNEDVVEAEGVETFDVEDSADDIATEG